jgi:hypothetical protein
MMPGALLTTHCSNALDECSLLASIPDSISAVALLPVTIIIVRRASDALCLVEPLGTWPAQGALVYSGMKGTLLERPIDPGPWH